MGKKEILSNLFRVPGVGLLSTSLHTRLTKQLRILAYHRIMDIPVDYPFDEELISANRENFEYQIKYLAENMDPITFDDVINHLEKGLSLPKRAILVTFDDGFDDNYYYAFPILKSYKVPATFFISTGYIDTNMVFWFDWVSYLVKYATKNNLVFNDKQFSFLNNKVLNITDKVDEFLLLLKRVSDRTRHQLITQLESAVDIIKPEKGYKQSHALTWAQVQEMSDHGMYFGSHAVSHPILANLSKDELQYELTESKRQIEQKLQRPCEIIAYPVGMEWAFTVDVVSSVRDAGYKFGLSYIHGTNKIDSLRNSRYALNRLHIERYVSRHYFSAMCSLPGIF